MPNAIPQGDGGGSWYIIKAIGDWLEKQGVDFTTEQLYNAYNEVMTRWTNADRTNIINENGVISNKFVQAVAENVQKAAETTGTPGGEYEPPPIPGDDETTYESPKSIRAGFLSILQSWGIAVTDNLMKLVRTATQDGWSYDAFTYYLRKTPEYQQAFPGILGPNGLPTMTEAEYLNNIRQYETYASRYGIDLTPSDQAWLFRNEVSPDEFASRAQAYKLIESNRDMYKQFEKSLMAEGVIPKGGNVTDEELLRFVMGEGNSEWYDVWNLTRARYVATQAGIRLSKGADAYLSLNPHLIEKLADKGLSDEALASGFADVAENLQTTLPLSKLQKYGITKQDLIQASFGGPKSQEIRAKIERIQEQDRQFYGSRANPASYAAQGGGLGVQGVGTQEQAQSD